MKPDTISEINSFGVDHYRPKDSFPELTTSYTNLFYCCNACNSRKGAYWPVESKLKIEFIPNPCDHVMFSHVQFIGSAVSSKTIAGNFMIDLLDLDASESKNFRAFVIRLIETCNEKRNNIKSLIENLSLKVSSGQLAKVTADSEIASLSKDLDLLEKDIKKLCGDD